MILLIHHYQFNVFSRIVDNKRCVCVYVFDFLSLRSYTSVYSSSYWESVGFATSDADFEKTMMDIIRYADVDDIKVNDDGNILYIEPNAAAKLQVGNWIPSFEACEISIQGNSIHSNIGKLFTEISDLKKKLADQQHLIDLLATGSKQLILHRRGDVIPQLDGKHNVRIYCYKGLYNFYIFGSNYRDYYDLNAAEVYKILDHLFTHNDLRLVEIYDPDVPLLSDLLPYHLARINIMIVNGDNMKLDRIINNTMGNSYREVTLIGFNAEATVAENLDKLYAAEVLIETSTITGKHEYIAIGNKGRYDPSKTKFVNLARHFPVH